MLNLGTVRPGSTIYIPFDTFAGATGASATLTGLAVGDIKIYKAGSVTERASTTGFTLLDTDGIDFDGITGLHGFSIDLSSNATAGFYTCGSRFMVAISSVTIDSQTVNFWAATFEIGYPDAILNTTIASLSSQTSFTLTAGPAEASALVGCPVIIHDIASSSQMGHAVISAYAATTRTITLSAATTFTVAAGDNISVFAPANTRWIGAALPSAATIGTVSTLTGHTAQSGDAFARLGAPAGASVSADIAALPTAAENRAEMDSNSTQLAAIVADTNELQTDDIPGLIAALNDLSAAEVNAEVDTAIADAGLSDLTSLVMTSGTAQAGSDTTITLASGAESSLNNAYVGAFIVLTGGTGAPQVRRIDAYTASTRVASIDTDWQTNPSSDTTYVIFGAQYSVMVGSWAAPASNVAALQAGNRLAVDVIAISGDTAAANNAESFFDGTGYAGTNNVIPTVTTLTGHTPQTGDSFARLGAPAGASIAADIAANQTDLDAILADTNELQTDDIPGLIAALNDLSAAEVNAEVDTALADIHLDHLLAATYDPASKPGVADALFNELIENDGGVSRFTANALEQGPSGGGSASPFLLQSTTIATLASQTSFTLTAGSADDDAYINALIVVTDQSTSTQKAFGYISDYVGSTRTVTLASDPGVFTMAVGDSIDVIAFHPLLANLDAAITTRSSHTAADVRTEMDSNSTQLAAIVADTNELQTDDVPALIAALNDPTAAAIADAVWDEAKSGHTTSGSFGEEVQAHATNAEVASALDLTQARKLTDTTINVVNSQTNFTLTSGPDYDDILIGQMAIIVDFVTDRNKHVVEITDYVGSTKTVTIASAPPFTIFGSGIEEITIWGNLASGSAPSAADIRAEIDSNSTQLAAIVADTNELQTDDVPGLIAALNNLSTSDIDARLAAIGLDHLLSTSVTGTDVANDSVFAQLVSASGTADWDDFDNTTDSLQALQAEHDATQTDIGAISAGSNPTLLQTTTIATLASQTSFTLTAGSADDDAYNNQIIIVVDQSTSTQKAVGIIQDYVGSTRTVTLDTDPGIFTMAVGDTVYVVATSPAASAPSAAAIRAEIDSNSTQLAAIVADTNELQTDDIPSLIAALNNISAGDVNTQVAAALATYDPPTRAELTSDIGTVASAIAGLNDPTAGAIADAVWDEAKSGHVASGSFGEEVQAHSLSSEISALNNLSAAQVNAEVDSALADYDGPSRTELTSDINSILAILGTPAGADLAADIAANQTDLDAILLDTGTTIPAQISGLSIPTAAQIRAEMDSNSTQLAAILADTNELQTDDVPGLIAALNNISATDIVSGGAITTSGGAVSTVTNVTNQVAANMTAVSGSSTAADNLELSALSIIPGTAQSGTLSTTQMSTNLSETTDDHYIGRIIIWTSGNLVGQASDITDYAGTNGVLTFTAVTEAPSNSDTFIIV